jgi:hypothetical protein
MATPFTKVTVLPSYAEGFTFTWEISKGFADPLPWRFTVEEGPGSDGPWTALSPEVVNIFAYVEIDKRRVLTKDLVLFFRIKLETPQGTYYSEVRTPYGDLNRREYLISRDIMRREVLQQRTMAGIQAILWVKNIYGLKCPFCRDPITGDITTTNCKYCLGTGYLPPYTGPYHIWATFSPTSRNIEVKSDGEGLQQVYSWQVRMIGFPYVKDQDIVVDLAQDKRYIVDGIQHLMEIRRISLVQTLRVLELPMSDPVYKLGTGLVGEDGCILP